MIQIQCVLRNISLKLGKNYATCFPTCKHFANTSHIKIILQSLVNIFSVRKSYFMIQMRIIILLYKFWNIDYYISKYGSIYIINNKKYDVLKKIDWWTFCYLIHFIRMQMLVNNIVILYLFLLYTCFKYKFIYQSLLYFVL